MNFDRNTVFGFVALALLFLGYFYFTSREQQAVLAEKARQDSIRKRAEVPASKTTATLSPDSNKLDTQATPVNAGPFTQTAQQKITIVENEVFRVAFSNKGGQPDWVELKNFKAPDSGLVKLAASEFDRINYPVISAPNQTVNIADVYFSGGDVQKNADGSQTITFQLNTGTGSAIIHQYVVKRDNYMIDFKLQVNGAQQLLAGNTVNLAWHNKAKQLQPDFDYEKQQSAVGYSENGDYDDHVLGESSSHDFDDPVNWVSIKQQFFNSTIVAKNKFSSGNVEWSIPENKTDANTLVDATANLKLKLENNGVAALGLYYGPNDYKILKTYDNNMEDLVNLGTGVFAFVKYINRWIILPVFDILKNFSSNYGIVILLLTLFIRLLTSPLMYPGYLTSAKMRVLRPELEELKKKYPDQQAYAMEQMKFMREAGVNQFAGCLPGLLQIPIFFALYSFFNAHVALRGEEFLWAKDLSVYDSILNFGHIPLINSIYGSHVSLFTITAVLTSFLISLYSMSSTPDQGNPVLKYMPYFFPIILLFIFNKLPSALTWYYTVSNIITLMIQFVITNYIINHDKVLAKIEENRKKPKTKSKWQEKMEQMQEQQRRMQEQQKRK